MSASRPELNRVDTTWPSQQAQISSSRSTHPTARQPERARPAPSAFLGSGGGDAPPPAARRPVRGGGRALAVECLVLLVLGLCTGVAVAFALRDQLPRRPGSVEAARAVDAAPPPAAVEPEVGGPAVFDPAVLRFAWASTCEVALGGVVAGAAADRIRSIRTAHEHAALFEWGVVPDDVRAVLDEAHGSTVSGQIGDEAAVSTLRGRIGGVCAAWSARIDATG